MSNGIIGAFFFLIIVAAVCMGLLMAFSLHNQDAMTTDSYGTARSKATNSTEALATSISAPLFSLQEGIIYLAAVFVVLFSVLAVWAASRGSSGSSVR